MKNNLTECLQSFLPMKKIIVYLKSLKERLGISLEKEIDTMVFKLYDLTYEEVLEVLHSTDPEGEFWMSREENEGYKLD